jgi:hypothetical protein
MNKDELKKLIHEEGVKNGKKAWAVKRKKYGDSIGDIQRRGPAAKITKNKKTAS